MNRWLLSALIAGAGAAVGCFVWAAWPPTPQYVPIEICIACIGLSFMVAGIAAWQRWPASRLGLLFTIVGYLYLVPYILINLANPVAFTIGYLSQPIYAAALIHLGLAWPSGRLRSRFERGVVVANYVQSIAFSVAATMLWNPAFSGCNASCPANVLLVGDGSMPAWNAVNTISGYVGVAFTVIVLTLIVRHWRSARGWSRRAIVPVVWIGFAIGLEQTLIGVPSTCPCLTWLASVWPSWCCWPGRSCSSSARCWPGRRAARWAPRSWTWNPERRPGNCGMRWPGRSATRLCSWHSSSRTRPDTLTPLGRPSR